jgi:hypothetical protein
VQERYKDLDLTGEQAAQIYRYEQDKNTYSEKHYFSPWEEWDYELTTFREILNRDQLAIYEAFIRENMQNHERSLIEQDKEKSNDMAFHKALISFYETQFLPGLYKEPFLYFGWLYTDRTKVEYLRSEYRRFLHDSKKAILTSHFRHHRTFKPNTLKLLLLAHQLTCILPDYSSFKRQMDEPTKAIAQYLKAKLRYLPDNTEELVARKFSELKAFHKTNFQKHYGEAGGWHVAAEQLTKEDETEQHMMTLLLLDKEQYGC